MPPYRDDDDALRRQLAASEQRAARAEARARAAERRLRAARGSGWLLGLFRRRAMPSASATLRLSGRDVPCRDSPIDLDLTAQVAIGADRERRTAAARHFVGCEAVDLADAAAPLVEAALRRALALRTATEVRDGLDRVGLDVKLAAQSALRDLGLEVGTLSLSPPGGVVTVTAG